MASWSYHGNELDVTNSSESGDSQYFVDSGEWNLIGIPVTRNTLYYSCCLDPYPDVTFHIIFQVKFKIVTPTKKTPRAHEGIFLSPH